MKFNKPINREAEINNETYVVTMDDGGVSFRVKGKRKSQRAEWSAILLIARAEAPETERNQSPREEAPVPDTISMGATAGEGTQES